MRINSILSILLVLLAICILVGLLALLYVHRWAIKHQKKRTNDHKHLEKQSVFFTPYIPASIIKQQQKARTQHQKEATRIQKIKRLLIFSISSVLILIPLPITR